MTPCTTCGLGVTLPHADFCEGIRNGTRKFSVPCGVCRTRYVPTICGNVMTGCPTCRRAARARAVAA